MSDRITPEIEPPPTSSEVHPSLSEPSLGVSADMKVVRPFAVGHRIGIRVGDPGLSSIMELGFVTKATVGTRNVKHMSGR
jgi:hypothetical protein